MKTVNLHGGPMHGQRFSLEDDRDHMHIVVQNPAYQWGQNDSTVLPTREGMYSRVFGKPDDFEWDGFRNHD